MKLHERRSTQESALSLVKFIKLKCSHLWPLRCDPDSLTLGVVTRLGVPGSADLQWEAVTVLHHTPPVPDTLHCPGPQSWHGNDIRDNTWWHLTWTAQGELEKVIVLHIFLCLKVWENRLWLYVYISFKTPQIKFWVWKQTFTISIFFTLLLEGRGVTQSCVAQVALTDLSLIPNHFTYSCDTHVECLGWYVQ